jgi:hypothetical protein
MFNAPVCVESGELGVEGFFVQRGGHIDHVVQRIDAQRVRAAASIDHVGSSGETLLAQLGIELILQGGGRDAVFAAVDSDGLRAATAGEGKDLRALEDAIFGNDAAHFKAAGEDAIAQTADHAGRFHGLERRELAADREAGSSNAIAGID